MLPRSVRYCPPISAVCITVGCCDANYSPPQWHASESVAGLRHCSAASLLPMITPDCLATPNLYTSLVTSTSLRPCRLTARAGYPA
jgi:hypothetical protein